MARDVSVSILILLRATTVSNVARFKNGSVVLIVLFSIVTSARVAVVYDSWDSEMIVIV